MAIGNCQTPEELAEAIAYHLKQGGMRRDYCDQTGLRETKYDEFETKRLYGIALNKYNEIRKLYPNLPSLQIATSDPLSGLAQIQQLCTSKQKSLQEIIEVLKNWQESEKTQKDLEEAKQALSPLGETHEILCEGKDFSRKTKKALQWLDMVADRKEGFCRALLNELASPEVIADLEKWLEQSAETGQGNKDAKSEGEGGFIDNTKPTIKKLLSKNFIKATIKHFPYCGSYLFDIIYGVDGMKEQKEKTDLSIIARDNIDRTTPEPEKEKGGWELVKKISLVLGIMVSLIVIVGGYNKYIRKDKPAIERIKTPNLSGNSVDVNRVVFEARPTADEIIEEIERLPAFEQKAAAENYKRRTFKWRLRFKYLVHEKGGMVYVLCKTSSGRGEVDFNINADTKENLKIKKIKKGKFLDVSGEIMDILLDSELRIGLKDVRLEFVD